MGKLVYCLPCGTRRKDVPATTERDGDPMCFACAKLYDAPPTSPVHMVKTREQAILCNRGCGNAKHRGRCARVTPSAEAAAAAVAKFPEVNMAAALVAVGHGMLKGRVIALDKVPDSSSRVAGRIGALWETLMALKPGEAWEEPCATTKQASMTDRHMKLKARKKGVTIISKRIGTRYFCARPLEGR